MQIGLADVFEPLRSPLERALSARHRTTIIDPVAPGSGAACDVVVHGRAETDSSTAVDRATRGAWRLLTTLAPQRYVQLSSMRVFDGYPPGWDITEAWVPRPTTDSESLVAYLGELTGRELCRARPIEGIALRLGRVVDAEEFDRGPVQPDWLHVDDAVRAIVQAVEGEELPGTAARWRPLHIVRGDETSRFPLGMAVRAPFSFHAEHSTTAPAPTREEAQPTFPEPPAPMDDLPVPSRITVYGAGGPLGAVTASALHHDHQLLLTDARTLADAAKAPPQSPGAPLPKPATPPHRERVVDIGDAAAVLDAARDADCLINCAVVRHEADLAFAVNVLGTLHVMTAAADLGIPRVVATGPSLVLAPHPIGYNDDPDIDDDTPPRPGDDLYFLTKFLSAEISRIYAETYRIACPMLLFCGFVNPRAHRDRPVHPFSISWPDSGRAVAAAATVTSLPEPMPVLHVLAPSPHGRYRTGKAERVLGWRPQDRLDHYWYRDGGLG